MATPYPEVFVNSLCMHHLVAFYGLLKQEQTVTPIQATRQIIQFKSTCFKFPHLAKNASQCSGGRFTHSCHAWLSGLIPQELSELDLRSILCAPTALKVQFLVKLAFSGHTTANYRALKIDQMILSKSELFP